MSITVLATSLSQSNRGNQQDHLTQHREDNIRYQASQIMASVQGETSGVVVGKGYRVGKAEL
mgnify:CR=1 FL=1